MPRVPIAILPKFSLVLPAYKQAAHIAHTIESYRIECDKAGLSSFEMIIVINGPDDGTLKIVQNMAQKDSRIAYIVSQKSGWGAAVRTGLSAAQGTYVCYTNTARTAPYDLVRLMSSANEQSDLIYKAVRYTRDSIFRTIGTKIYNTMFNVLFNSHVLDVNGTPKVFKRSILTKVRLQSDGDLIDAELIAKSLRHNISIIEIPISSTKRVSGVSTTTIKSALKMYFGLLRLYFVLRWSDE